jgi:hypothetical protein
MCEKYVNRLSTVFITCDQVCNPYIPGGPSYIHSDKNYSSNFIYCPRCGKKLIDTTPKKWRDNDES